MHKYFDNDSYNNQSLLLYTHIPHRVYHNFLCILLIISAIFTVFPIYTPTSSVASIQTDNAASKSDGTGPRETAIQTSWLSRTYPLQMLSFSITATSYHHDMSSAFINIAPSSVSDRLAACHLWGICVLVDPRSDGTNTSFKFRIGPDCRYTDPICSLLLFHSYFSPSPKAA